MLRREYLQMHEDFSDSAEWHSCVLGVCPSLYGRLLIGWQNCERPFQVVFFGDVQAFYVRFKPWTAVVQLTLFQRLRTTSRAGKTQGKIGLKHSEIVPPVRE